MTEQQTTFTRRQPSLIQRCILDRRDGGMRYEYMGSSEFEFGDQAQSLRKILAGAIEVKKCEVRAGGRNVKFYMVARSDFAFAAYCEVIQGLVNQDWRLQEDTYLDLVLRKRFHTDTEKRLAFVQTEAWFDFENDVLFTLSEENAKFIVSALDGVKEAWRKKEEWLNSPPVKKFKIELEKLKARLKKSGKDWISLDKIQECDGELKVWLNPHNQQRYNFGWWTLQDLRYWLNDKGPIIMKKKEQEKVSA